MFENIPMILVITYYIIFVFLFLCNIKLTNIQLKILNLIFLISIVLVAYNFIPTQEMDLYRYHLMLDSLTQRELSWNQILYFGPYNKTIITNIYFNIMSKIKYSWFTVPPTVIIFSSIFYTGRYFNKNYKISFRAFYLFMISVISVSSLLGIVTGIRQNVAWVLLMLAIYYDFYNKNKKRSIVVLFYILPILVHSSAIPFIGLRLLLILIQKIPSLKYILVLWPILLFILPSIGSSLPIFLQDALQTLGYHFNRDYIMTAKFAVAIPSYIFLFYMAICIGKNEKNIMIINKNYYNYYMIVLLFGITSIFIPTLFERTFELIIYISLPMISASLSTRFIFRRIIILVILSMFVILFYWQDLMVGHFF